MLADLVTERHRSYGDVGFLLEPDLKEAHGGLRDVAALAALMLAVPVLADYVDTVAIDDARAALTAIRVELHRRAGREQNKLLLQEQDQVAGALAMADSDALMLTVATAGRTVAWEGDDAWRRRGAWSRQQGGRRGLRRSRSAEALRHRVQTARVTVVPGDPDIGVTDDEVVLTEGADAGGDPSLALRLAAVAPRRTCPSPGTPSTCSGARRRLPRPRGRTTCGPPWSGSWPPGRRPSPPSRPWTSGGCSSGTSPSGRRCGTSPSATRITASPWTGTSWRRRPTRPRWPTGSGRVDLLLIGTLLHDIGKGFPGDHTEVGMTVVREIGTRMGFPPDDVDTLVTLVRLHLLLPDTATRRDLDDPATAERVADEVGNRTTLDLLAALVEADSLATGPSAWGSWKAGLVADLVERTSRLLAGEPVAPPTPWITDEIRLIMDTVRTQGVPALSIDDPTVMVVAPDRSGLLAEVTGVLALHGLNVRSADGGRGGRRRRRDLHRRAVEGPMAVGGPPGRRPGRHHGRNPVRRGPAGRAGPHLPERAPGHHAEPGVDRGDRGQQRLGHGHGGRGAGRGRGRAAPPDHPGAGRLSPRRDVGQGLHLRFRGGGRLLRPRPRRQQGHRRRI